VFVYRFLFAQDFKIFIEHVNFYTPELLFVPSDDLVLGQMFLGFLVRLGC